MYPGVDAVLLLPLLLAVRVCSVCKGEGEEIEALVSIILRAMPVRWVSLRPRASVVWYGGSCFPARERKIVLYWSRGSTLSYGLCGARFVVRDT